MVLQEHTHKISAFWRIILWVFGDPPYYNVISPCYFFGRATIKLLQSINKMQKLPQYCSYLQYIADPIFVGTPLAFGYDVFGAVCQFRLSTLRSYIDDSVRHWLFRVRWHRCIMWCPYSNWTSDHSNMDHTHLGMNHMWQVGAGNRCCRNIMYMYLFLSPPTLHSLGGNRGLVV